MTFLTRSIGQTVDIPLAEVAPDEDVRAQLEEAGAVARVAMVTGAIRDAWAAAAIAADAASQRDLADLRKIPIDQRTEQEQAHIDAMSAPKAPERIVGWARMVLEDCLLGLTGWAPGVDDVTEPRALTDEMQRHQRLMISLAQRAMSEQLPTRRAEKS